MNPLSAFSFGKIIKTFLPGLIATAIPLLLLEFLYRTLQSEGPPTAPLWKWFLSHSFLWQVVLKDSVRATTLGAALLPCALILGFFLNTVLWLWINPRFRRWVDQALDERLLEVRRGLETRANHAIAARQDAEVRPVLLQAFYLPLMDLQKLSFLQETYFSWYEFQVNSAAAVSLAWLFYALTFGWILWPLGSGPVAGYLGLPLLLVIATVWLLAFAAKSNLKRYQESFLWFLLGSLHFHEAKPTETR